MAASLSIVIPVYNEAASIINLLEEILYHASTASFVYEVLIVDDGSNDETESVVEAYIADKPNFQFIKHMHNRGQSAGILTGIRSAQNHWIVTLDGDGQNDPADIIKFQELIAEYDQQHVPLLIMGNRNRRQDSVIKRFSSRVANHVRNFLLRDNCLDAGCGLKMFRKQDALVLPLFDHFHRFLPALITGAGGIVLNVPVNHRPRTKGYSKYGVWNRLWVGIVDIMGVMWLRRRARCWSVK